MNIKNKKFCEVSLVVVAVTVSIFGLVGLIRAAATTVSLMDGGDADRFAVLAGGGITIAAPPGSVITGDIGSYATTDITGLENLTLNGTNQAGNGVTQLAKDALTNAYNNAAGQTSGATAVTATTGNSFNITGSTLLPGIYKSTSTMGVTGTLTLNGSATDIWIFQAVSSLTTAEGSIIALTGGAQACNVFWTVGTDATLGGTNSIFKGSILALNAISVGTTATVEGRLLASVAAVTLAGTNTITKATCAAATPTPAPSRAIATINVVKNVINDNGRTKIAADFPLFVNGGSVLSGVTNTFPAPASVYTVTETRDANYTRVFSGDCDINGQLNLNPGDNKFCIVTNNDIGAPLVIPPVPPLIDVLKMPSPLALPGGPGPVTYTYTLRNVGTVPVTDVTMVGDTCSPIVRVSGDTNGDNKLDVTETWTHTCTTTLTETHTNIVTATGWANGISAVDVASATVVVGAPVVPPLIHLVKRPSVFTLPAGGGPVTYTYVVSNPGTATLSNVKISSDKCTGTPSRVLGHPGDINKNNLLESGEEWLFTCLTNITQTTTNTGVASGEANGLTARDLAVATVVVAATTPRLPATGIAPDENSISWNIVLSTGIFIAFLSFYFILRKQEAY